MANYTIALTLDNGRVVMFGLSSDTKQTTVSAGSTAYETDTANEFTFNGSSWDQISTGGAARVRTASLPSTLENREWTIGADTDCVTTQTAPIAAELLLANAFTSGLKHCRVTYHTEPTTIPFASSVAIALNCSGAADALNRLDYVDKSVGDTADTDTQKRILSAQQPVAEFDLTDTSDEITNLYGVGWLAQGTGVGNVYISIEVW